MNVLNIYTDGGCTGNPGAGGWAAVLLPPGGEPITLSGGEKHTTNNRMELTAVIKALEKVLAMSGEKTVMELHTDSQYVQKGISLWMKTWTVKGWKTSSGSPIKNKDLWVHLEKLSGRLHISWRWVKGHAGNPWNELCDSLVKKERIRYG